MSTTVGSAKTIPSATVGGGIANVLTREARCADLVMIGQNGLLAFAACLDNCDTRRILKEGQRVQQRSSCFTGILPAEHHVLHA